MAENTPQPGVQSSPQAGTVWQYIADHDAWESFKASVLRFSGPLAIFHPDNKPTSFPCLATAFRMASPVSAHVRLECAFVTVATFEQFKQRLKREKKAMRAEIRRANEDMRRKMIVQLRVLFGIVTTEMGIAPDELQRRIIAMSATADQATAEFDAQQHRQVFGDTTPDVDA